MPSIIRFSRRRDPRRGPARSSRTERRGAALLLSLLLAAAFISLAFSAYFLSAHANILSRNFDRERDYRYAAEAALALGKSRVNSDGAVVPDTGYAVLLRDEPMLDATGQPIDGVTVNVWVGKSGSTTGQFGTFASVVAEARDAVGSRVVRRVELTQESFAKYAYWSDRETNISGGKIYFNNNDVLWGPVWSNDEISIGSGRATFNDDVGTARTVAGKFYGTFRKKLLEKQKPIELPTMSKLGKLAGYAAQGSLSWTTPNSSGASGVKERIEFIAINLNPAVDNDVTDPDEGFVRVYTAHGATSAAYVRGDRSDDNCGDWHVDASGRRKFYPVSVHDDAWFKAQITVPGVMTSSQANTHGNLSSDRLLAQKDARCFPGGDPHLVAIERNTAGFTTAQWQKGGEDSTFTVNGRYGRWRAWPGAVDARLAGRADAGYLFPLHRSLNPSVQGVIHTNGTVAVSGVVRGRITLYSTGTIVLVDDLRYASDPSSGECADMLGLIAGSNIHVADNAINTPQYAQSAYRNLDDTKDFHIHAVMMALNTSFGVEDYDTGPTNANGCEGTNVGRGCLYLSGGIIQVARGAVGLSSGQGFIKRYSYDRCALQSPPPYYPTTGRYDDNRYFEVDPVGFDVGKLFQSLTAAR